ncbi:MAG: SIMPL domain-containing protein [Xenococcaceae cyanobacterium MO_188.B19]|nr:SIMPL domain-containing protein [Xenococcaceae cyanobacterium MO_188.B19]
MKINQFTIVCQRFLAIFTVFLFCSLVWINPAMAQEQAFRTLTVTGQGIERIPTTLTQVQLGVEIQGKSAGEVQQNVAKRTSAVVDFLKSHKVERLQTTGISLQANYQYNNNERRLTGYIGTNTVSFRTETEKVGALLDKSVQAGATRIDGVSFTATEEAISTAQKEALRLATRDAQEQAEAVLGALNFKAKEIVNIQVAGANIPQPRMMQTGQFARSASVESTPVIGGEQTVRASVTLQIHY